LDAGAQLLDASVLHQQVAFRLPAFVDDAGVGNQVVNHAKVTSGNCGTKSGRSYGASMPRSGSIIGMPSSMRYRVWPSTVSSASSRSDSTWLPSTYRASPAAIAVLTRVSISASAGCSAAPLTGQTRQLSNALSMAAKNGRAGADFSTCTAGNFS